MTTERKWPYAAYGVECGAGWKKLYQPLLDLTKLYEGEVLQVKEKFGGLRFYANAPDEAGVWLEAMINAAEAASYHTCEDCGEDGQTGWDTAANRPIYKATCKGPGWIRSLCDPCRAAWQAKRDAR